MASEFQSSFIPKSPVTEEVFAKKKAGFFGIVVVSVFIFSVILSAAMYFYKGIISEDISSLRSQLASSEQTLDKETINNLIVFNDKLNLVKSLVWKHKVISRFMNSLASSTVSTVSFSSFDFNSVNQGNIKITMRGKAPSYGSLALQEDVFSKNKYFKKIEFSDLTLSEQNMVSFTVSVDVDPEIVVYSPVIENVESPKESLLPDLQSEIEELESIDLDSL